MLFLGIARVSYSMPNSNRFIVALLTCAAIVTLRHATIAQEKGSTMSAPIVLDFSESEVDSTTDWNDRRYGSHTNELSLKAITPSSGVF